MTQMFTPILEWETHQFYWTNGLRCCQQCWHFHLLYSQLWIFLEEFHHFGGYLDCSQSLFYFVPHDSHSQAGSTNDKLVGKISNSSMASNNKCFFIGKIPNCTNWAEAETDNVSDHKHSQQYTLIKLRSYSFDSMLLCHYFAMCPEKLKSDKTLKTIFLTVYVSVTFRWDSWLC